MRLLKKTKQRRKKQNTWRGNYKKLTGNDPLICLKCHIEMEFWFAPASEIIVLKPAQEGAIPENANTIDNVKTLLETGLTPAEVIIPITEAPELKTIFHSIKG